MRTCLMLVCAWLMACEPSKTTSDPNEPCGGCSAGFLCVDRQCMQVCNSDDDCTEGVARCDDGLCVTRNPPVVTLRDPSSSADAFTGTTTVEATVSSDATATHWCLSETQTTKPASSDSSCVGGLGSANGWTTSRPTSYVLSSGDAAKTVYLWVAESDSGVIPQPGTAHITLDTAEPTLSLDGTPDDPSGARAEFSFSGADAASGLAGFRCEVDGGGERACTSPHVLTDLSEGMHQFRVRAMDRTGNLSQAISHPWQVVTPHWQVFMGGPGHAAEGAAAQANVGGAQNAARHSIVADGDDNVYFVKRHAIMKLDAATDRVARFAGSIETNDCTWQTGANALTTHVTSPRIVGTTQDRTGLFVLSGPCGRIYRLGVDGALTEWVSFEPDPVDGYLWFLTGNRVLLLTHSEARKLYLVDLSSPGGSLTELHGDGTCAPVPAVGTSALGAPIQDSPYGYCFHFQVYANADASRIWLNSYAGYNAYRLDWDGSAGFYRIGSVDEGWMSIEHSRCIATDFDERIYCSPYWNGRSIAVFDLGDETWGTPSEYPFENDDDSGFLTIGSTADGLVGLYSLNTIQKIEPDPANAWTYTPLAGQSLASLGNGQAPELVGFSDPIDIEYNAATQLLWVRNFIGHLRRVDFKTVPPTTSTDYQLEIGPGYRSINTNLAGDRMAGWSSWARQLIVAFEVDATGLDLLPRFLDGPVELDVGAYPPPSGASASDGSALFIQAPNWDLASIAYHPNGRVYFGGRDETDDVFLFSSDASVINRVAGRVGPGGYAGSDEGQPALGAALTRIDQIQVEASGDLLIWDGDRLRRITLMTEPTEPRIYTVLNYATIPGYSTGTRWLDALYDEASDATYFVDQDYAVRKIVPGERQYTYDFTGTTLIEAPRIALLPFGLLVLEREEARLLVVEP